MRKFAECACDSEGALQQAALGSDRRKQYRAVLPLCGMAYSCNFPDRMLAHQFASTSSRNVVDVKPARVVPRQRGAVRILAAATLSPSKSTASPPLDQVKDSGSGPGRVFLSSTRAAAGQLWGVLKFFQAEEEAALSSETDSNVMQETAKRANEVS